MVSYFYNYNCTFLTTQTRYALHTIFVQYLYVKTDSLSTEDNPYLHDISLKGVVISIGRHVVDKSNGQSRIEHKIALGETPAFDDDTTSPEIIINGILPVSNIFVLGVSAIPGRNEAVK